MIKKIFKGSFIYTLGTQAPMVANLFVLPLLTPFLTSKDYAIWGLTFAYIGGLSAFKDLGTNLTAFNAYYHFPQRYKIVWQKVLGFQFLWSIPYVTLVALILGLSIRKYDPSSIYFILFFSCMPIVFFDATNAIGFRYFQLKEKPGKIFIISVFVTLISIGLNYYCVRILRMGYKAWFISSFVGSASSFIYYGYFIYVKEKMWPIFNIKYRWLKKTFKVTIPTIPHYYSSYLLNFSDRLILDFYKIPAQKIGHYNIAFNFGNYFSVIQQSITMVVNPIYFSLFKENNLDADKKIRSLTFSWNVISICIGFFLSLWIKEIFTFLYRNEDLRSAYVYAPLLIMSFAFQPMYVASLSKTIYLEKTNDLMKITGVAGLANVILNLIFIPLYGVPAAVAITFTTYAYKGFAAFYLTNVNKNTSLSYWPTTWVFTFFIVSIAAFFAPELPMSFKLLLTIVAMVLPLFFIRFIKNLIISLR
jgi:O-antigen/teichoic acid export membrane protein